MKICSIVFIVFLTGCASMRPGPEVKYSDSLETPKTIDYVGGTFIWK